MTAKKKIVGYCIEPMSRVQIRHRKSIDLVYKFIADNKMIVERLSSIGEYLTFFVTADDAKKLETFLESIDLKPITSEHMWSDQIAFKG
jgi:hypothetical protein